KQRQVMVDLDHRLLQSKGLSPADVVTALGQQNVIVPSGTAKIGSFEYDVAVNGSPRTVAELNQLPVKVVGGTPIYLGDVAQVRDGFTPQTNVVRRDGTRGTLVTILKNGNASTLDVVAGPPRGRPPGGLGHDSQERQPLDARRRGGHPRAAPPGDSDPTAAAQDPAAGRPVDLRARRRERGDPRSRDRGVSHRHHDPDFPWQLAQHADHLGVY